MDCSRRSFLKGMFGCAVAVSLPDLSGRRVVKFERRFAPGQFFYLEYGPHDPPRILEDGFLAQTVRWDGSKEAAELRTGILKDIVLNLWRQPTKEAFDAYAEGIFQVCMEGGVDSSFESSAILLMATDPEIFKGPGATWRQRSDFWIRETLCGAFLRHPSFMKWRNYHSGRIHAGNGMRGRPSKEAEEDCLTLKEFCNGPRFSAYNWGISLTAKDEDLTPEDRKCRNEWLAKYGPYKWGPRDSAGIKAALSEGSWAYDTAVEKHGGKPVEVGT